MQMEPNQNRSNWQMAELEAAKARFEASEAILKLLRFEGGTPMKPLTEEEIIEWNKKLKKSKPG
jgi:hypothetical protein